MLLPDCRAGRACRTQLTHPALSGTPLERGCPLGVPRDNSTQECPSAGSSRGGLLRPTSRSAEGREPLHYLRISSRAGALSKIPLFAGCSCRIDHIMKICKLTPCGIGMRAQREKKTSPNPLLSKEGAYINRSNPPRERIFSSQ